MMTDLEASVAATDPSTFRKYNRNLCQNPLAKTLTSVHKSVNAKPAEKKADPKKENLTRPRTPRTPRIPRSLHLQRRRRRRRNRNPRRNRNLSLEKLWKSLTRMPACRKRMESRATRRMTTGNPILFVRDFGTTSSRENVRDVEATITCAPHARNRGCSGRTILMSDQRSGPREHNNELNGRLRHAFCLCSHLSARLPLIPALMSPRVLHHL